MFRPVSSKVNFPQVEENILNLWKENSIFKQSVDRRQGAPRFIFYEGPRGQSQACFRRILGQKSPQRLSEQSQLGQGSCGIEPDIRCGRV